MFERFAKPARAAVELAAAEAARRGDRKIGTEQLLVGVLSDPTLASALGTTAEAARDAIVELDRRALGAVGLESISVDVPVTPARSSRPRGMTAGGKTMFQRALALAAAERSREIAARHLALALLEAPQQDPVTAVLREMGAESGQWRLRLTA